MNGLEAARLDAVSDVRCPSGIPPIGQMRERHDGLIELGEKGLLHHRVDAGRREGLRRLVAQPAQGKLPLLVMHRVGPTDPGEKWVHPLNAVGGVWRWVL